jgi:transcriptional regulator with XRE-family HTH domain
MSIAANLRREMNANAVSVDALAARSGVEASFLRKYLSGKSKPSDAVLMRLARGIGVPVESINRDPLTRMQGKVRPEDAARRLNRSPQDIRIGIQQGLLPFGRCYKRNGSSVFTYEIDPDALERYAEGQDKFWSTIVKGGKR